MYRRFYIVGAPVLIAILIVPGVSINSHQSALSKALANDSARGLVPASINTPAVLTQHNDTSRTGANLSETILNTSNVNVNQFGKLFSRAADGYIYAQPLYVPGVAIPGMGSHNVVYVATEHDSVYAYDADDPEAGGALWQVSLGSSVPSSDLPSGYYNLVPEIGITATPVIDPDSGLMYVVAKSKDSAGGYHQMLHALDITTGNEEASGPAEIFASFQGTGYDNADGTITFNPLLQLNRAGLLLANGMVYIAFGSHADSDPYHGWIMAYDAATLQQRGVYLTTPDGGRGGVWQSGQGLIADSSGNVYAMTGNGTCDADVDCGRNLGDSIIKLSQSLAVTDWFTPHNRGELDELDMDVGSGGAVLLPGTSLILGGGKDGILRLIDTNNMGRFDASANMDVQEFQATPNKIVTSPIYWNSPVAGPTVYIWPSGDSLKAFRFSNGYFQDAASDQSTIQTVDGNSNCSPLALSANGNAPGSGIVWASSPSGGNANLRTVSGILRAFDASDLTNELWDSTQLQSRDDSGLFAKFCPPTVANGKVYMASFSGVLNVYGLIPTDCNAVLSSNSQHFSAAGGTQSVTVTSAHGCLWQSSADAPFIALLPGVDYSGSGTQSYSVSANTGPARSGTISILNQQLVISQDSACSYSVSPANQKFKAKGGAGTAQIQSSDGCGWSVSTRAKWIQFDSAQSGQGPASLSYNVQPNKTSVARTGRIVIGGQTVLTITQTGKTR
jgi:hypothetical protein